MILQENEFDHISYNYDTIYSEKFLLSIYCVDILLETTLLKNDAFTEEISSSYFSKVMLLFASENNIREQTN